MDMNMDMDRFTENVFGELKSCPVYLKFLALDDSRRQYNLSEEVDWKRRCNWCLPLNMTGSDSDLVSVTYSSINLVICHDMGESESVPVIRLASHAIMGLLRKNYGQGFSIQNTNYVYCFYYQDTWWLLHTQPDFGINMNHSILGPKQCYWFYVGQPMDKQLTAKLMFNWNLSIILSGK